MDVIVAIDDKAGMMFNHRRQSRDRVMNERIACDLAGRTLFVAPYSVPLFTPFGVSLSASEDFLDRAAEEDVCFVEDRPLAPYRSRIRRLTVYRWNRHYPSDLTLDLSLVEFHLVSTENFVGSSHEKITKEVYQHD